VHEAREVTRLLLSCAGLVSAIAFSACEDGTDDGEPPMAPPIEADAGSFSIRVTNVGFPCSAENACQGTASICMTVSSTNTRYPGGYCTATCDASVHCGPGAVCPVGDAVGEDPSFTIKDVWPKTCFRSCQPSVPDGCRSGYVCRSLVDAYGLRGPTPSAMQTAVCIPIPVAHR
jgi:hypothetical protein